MQLTFDSSIVKKLLGLAALSGRPVPSLDLGHELVGPPADASNSFVHELTDLVGDPSGIALLAAADLEAGLNAGGER